jgi:hypothetical protein
MDSEVGITIDEDGVPHDILDDVSNDTLEDSELEKSVASIVSSMFMSSRHTDNVSLAKNYIDEVNAILHNFGVFIDRGLTIRPERHGNRIMIINPCTKRVRNAHYDALAGVDAVTTADINRQYKEIIELILEYRACLIDFNCKVNAYNKIQDGRIKLGLKVSEDVSPLEG